MKVFQVLIAIMLIFSVMLITNATLVTADTQACTTAIDCGTSGYTGVEFCTGKDVYKNYQEYSCVNSQCVLNTTPTRINQCQFACSAGVCILCNNDLDCNDNNLGTADVCVNPGVVQSYCTHTSNGAYHNVALEDMRFVGSNATDGGNNILARNKQYSVRIDIRNIGNFTENVTATGMLSQNSNNNVLKNWNYAGNVLFNFPPNNFIHDLPATVVFDVPVGYYNVTTQASINGDINLADNSRREQIIVVTCIQDSDCGAGYICQNGSMIRSVCEGVQDRLHDVAIEDVKFSNVINNILVRGRDYNVSVDLRNKGDFTESMNFNSKLLQGSNILQVYGHPALLNFPVGFRNYLVDKINFNVPVGYYNYSITASITNESTPSDNTRTEQIAIVNCVVNEDCSNGMICLNAGMPASSCMNNPNPTNVTLCSNRTSETVSGYGVSFAPVSNTVDQSSTNTLIFKIKNLESTQKTITYQKYQCRCDNHLGDPLGSCIDYWPEMSHTSNDGWRNSACKFMNETITLNANEEKISQVTVTQHQNKMCGLIQTDVALVKVNGVEVFQPMAWGVADMCVDCAPVQCNDDKDCNDHDSSTSDSCINKGTTESYCRNRDKTSGSQTCGDGICSTSEKSWCDEDCGLNSGNKAYAATYVPLINADNSYNFTDYSAPTMPSRTAQKIDNNVPYFSYLTIGLIALIVILVVLVILIVAIRQ